MKARGVHLQYRFETTAQALDLGPVDLYLIHAPWPWDEIGADHRKGNAEVWRALEEILELHPAVSTAFVSGDGHPFCVGLLVVDAKAAAQAAAPPAQQTADTGA